jgi:prepilin-type N-terminal cleavage/methylation domain-containing protein
MTNTHHRGFTLIELIIVLIVIGVGWFVWEEYVKPSGVVKLPETENVSKPEDCQSNPIACLKQTKTDLSAKLQALNAVIEQVSSKRQPVQNSLQQNEVKLAEIRLFLEQGKAAYQEAAKKPNQSVAFAGKTYVIAEGLKDQLYLWFKAEKQYENNIAQFNQIVAKLNQQILLLQRQQGEIELAIAQIDPQIAIIEAGVVLEEFDSSIQNAIELLKMPIQVQDVLRETAQIEKDSRLNPKEEMPHDKLFDEFLKKPAASSALNKPIAAPPVIAPPVVPETVVKPELPVVSAPPVTAPVTDGLIGTIIKNELQAISVMKKEWNEATVDFENRRDKAIDDLNNKVNQAIEKRDLSYQIGVAVMEKQSDYNADTQILELHLKVSPELLKLMSNPNLEGNARIKVDNKGVAQLWNIKKIPTLARFFWDKKEGRLAFLELVALSKDAYYHLSKIGLIKERYHDYFNTVIDTQTNLQWMRCLIGQEWREGRCQGEAQDMGWNKAQALKIDFAGYSDWRLPTIEELRSLVYCSSGKPAYFPNNGKQCEGDYQRPTLIQEAFPDAPASWVWSSSPVAGYTDYAWNVNFHDGNGYDDHRNANYHVRLVRGGQ